MGWWGDEVGGGVRWEGRGVRWRGGEMGGGGVRWEGG